MGDLIERDAVLKTMSGANIGGYITEKIMNIPAVNRWIPCSERLPEQGQRVIVQFRYNSAKNYTAISTARRTHIGSWTVDCMRYADKECVTVQAWMPLPDAYEPPKE